ncbi:kinase-like domain-containing protein [Cladochytrium replicatum]|nr:kinase-like domain-containing protein [Cladochytrium replicatum]
MGSMSDFDPYAKISEVFDDGRLVLTDVIGSGSFAVVYMAETVATPKRRFAVKALFKHGLTPTQINLQRREAMLLKHLGTAPVRNLSNKTTYTTDNHIVCLEKTVETDECIYLVMEWCRSDLYEVITTLANEGVTLSGKAVKHLFKQLVDAVSFCHDRGVSHRDLKPENVLISDGNFPEDFTLKLTDFGLATTENWTTDYGCGSIRYMAPEALANDGTNRGYHPALNDVWSLGVILFNMVTGKNPWHTPSEDDLTFSEYFAAELDGKNSTHARNSYLVEHFGVSMEAARLFGRIFRLNPKERCSIRDLKAMVDALDSFHIHSPAVVVPEAGNPIYSKTNGAIDAYSSPSLSMHRWASDTSGMDYSQPPAFDDFSTKDKTKTSSNATANVNQTVPSVVVTPRPHNSIDKQRDLVPPRGSTTYSTHQAVQQRSKRQPAGRRQSSQEKTKRGLSRMSTPVYAENSRPTEAAQPTTPSSPSSTNTSPRRARRRYQRSPLAPAPVVTSCAAAAQAAAAPPSTPTISMAEGAAAAVAQAMPYRRVIQDAASALRRIAAMFEDGRSSSTGGPGGAMAGRMTAAV